MKAYVMKNWDLTFFFYNYDMVDGSISVIHISVCVCMFTS